MTTVRRMTSDDLLAAQSLLSQLGYPLDFQELQRRFQAVSHTQDHALIAAEQNGQVTALCHIYARPALDKPPEAIVQALVVDRASRGTGIGKVMMAAAEAWARDRGFTSVALSSQITRSEAHSFYEAIGYRVAATSHLFRKTLD